MFTTLVTATALLAAVTAQPLQHLPGAKPSNPAEPLQHRSAFAGSNGTAHVVQWNTYGTQNASTVYYGLTQDISSFTSATGSQSTYNTSLTYTHTVSLSGLKAGSKYYWYAANTNCSGCQQIPLSTFNTAYYKGDKTAYSTLILADLGLMGIPEAVMTPVGSVNITGLTTADMSSSGNGAPAKAPANATTVQLNYTHNTMISVNNTVLAGNISFVTHVGDIAYADYVYRLTPGWTASAAVNATESLAGSEVYEGIIESFYDQIQPITSQVAYHVAVGNHEGSCSDGHNVDLCFPGQNNFTAYNAHWTMPSASSGGVKNMWYSYDNGMVHYVVLNSETDFVMAPSAYSGSEGQTGTVHDLYGLGPFIYPTIPNRYLQWLDNDLKSVDRSVTPWIVAQVHRPWYISNPFTAPESQVVYEPMFLKYDVDYVFHGHVHYFERTCPIKYGGICDVNEYNNPANAPIYITEGGAGKYGGASYDQAPLGYGGQKSYGDGTLAGLLGDALFQPFSRAYSEQFGYGVLTFHNATHASYGHIRSDTSQVIDYSTLYKDHIYNQPLGSVKYATTVCPPGLSICGPSCYDAQAGQVACSSGNLVPAGKKVHY